MPECSGKKPEEITRIGGNESVDENDTPKDDTADGESVSAVQDAVLFPEDEPNETQAERRTDEERQQVVMEVEEADDGSGTGTTTDDSTTDDVDDTAPTGFIGKHRNLMVTLAIVAIIAAIVLPRLIGREPATVTLIRPDLTKPGDPDEAGGGGDSNDTQPPDTSGEGGGKSELQKKAARPL